MRNVGLIASLQHLTPLVQYKVTALHQFVGRKRKKKKEPTELVQRLPCHFGFMIYYHVQLVTGNWNSADLLLNCGRDSFLLKTEADYRGRERQQI